MSKRLRGRDLRVERRRTGLSQAQLAAALGVHQSLISAVEREALGEYPDAQFAERFLAACEQVAA